MQLSSCSLSLLIHSLTPGRKRNPRSRPKLLFRSPLSSFSPTTFSSFNVAHYRGSLSASFQKHLFCPISNQLNFGCTFRETWKAANRSHQAERGAYKTTHDNQGLLHLSKQALIFWYVPHIQQPSDARDIFQLLSILKCQCKQDHQHRFHLN